MNILITLSSDSELMGYETIALAFTLASFDHHVQLYLTGDSHRLLQDSQSRLYGMIQSLDLYDLPLAWTDFEPSVMSQLDDVIVNVLTDRPADGADGGFDGVLEF